MKLNILLLSVDALRGDRLGISGYEYDTSPIIDKLAQNSIWCNNAFALAPCTQPSIPAIITSTKPLSFGGYDLGIKDRPNALSDVLKRNGYETHHLITFPWLRDTYGYGIGVDYSEHLYNITGIIGGTIHTIRSDVSAYENGDMESNRMLLKVRPIIEKCFDDLDEFCEERMRLHYVDRKYFPRSFFSVQGYNYNAIKKVVQKHRLMLRADPKFYIDSNIVGLPQQAVNSWISKEIKFKRKFIKRIEIVLNKFITLLLPLLSRYRLKNKIYVDSSELANRLVEKIYRYAESDQEQPFYLWTHFMDTHAPYCPGELPNWPKNSKKYLKDVGYVGKYNISEVCDKTPENQRSKEIWNAAYDCCVRYTDEQIGKIISALDETGLRDSTLVVILGDHGEEIGEHGEYGHRFRFYDECVNVPILFNMPNFKEAKISGLSDLTDIAPTILGICGIDIPKTYQGVDLSKPSNQKGKKFIQMEAFHRGNCSFKHKPVYMGIRTETHKYIWREWKDPEDVSSDSSNVELYDLEKDSSELINISEENSDIVDTMQEIVASRLSELTEYCKNRDKDALIKSGVNKYLE